jgi:hypothetical protein
MRLTPEALEWLGGTLTISDLFIPGCFCLLLLVVTFGKDGVYEAGAWEEGTLKKDLLGLYLLFGLPLTLAWLVWAVEFAP